MGYLSIFLVVVFSQFLNFSYCFNCMLSLGSFRSLCEESMGVSKQTQFFDAKGKKTSTNGPGALLMTTYWCSRPFSHPELINSTLLHRLSVTAFSSFRLGILWDGACIQL